MKALFLVPAVLAMQVTEDHGAAMNLKGDIEGMKELFLSVSKSQIDGATRQAVAAMMTEITGTLTSAVSDDMTWHQNSLDCKFAEIGNCAGDRTTWGAAQNVDGLHNASDDAKQAHRACRVTEQTQCDARDGLKSQCDDEVLAIQKCERRREHWDSNSATVKKWMECLHGQLRDVKAIVATHESYETTCKQQCATREDCNSDQTDFEVKMCNWMTKVDEMCSDYDECYTNEVERYQQFIVNAEAAWAVATTQMTALTVLKCYGQSILDNKTSLDHCNNLDCDGCPVSPCAEHCPDPPQPVPCDERTRGSVNETQELLPRPCEQTFLDEEYNERGMGSDTCTPAEVCTTCHDFHRSPFYFAGRGQCSCNVGGTKDDAIGTLSGANNAQECTELCKAWSDSSGTCNYVSWNADTHECVGLRNMDTQTQERPTAWSCYSRFSRHAAD